MMEGKAVITETDMLQTVQQDALLLAGDCSTIMMPEIAQFIKKDFDRIYGPGWQCIVGADFGYFVTHCCGCFIYFSIGSLDILLFRDAAAPEGDTAPHCHGGMNTFFLY